MDIKNTRTKLMVIAEVVDNFRIVPRFVLLSYSYMTYEVIKWFTYLESPTTEQASLVVTILSVAGLVIGLYQKSGKNWHKDDFKD